MHDLWHTLGLATALMLILEGLFPFLDPVRYRRYLLRVAQMGDDALRLAGLTALVVGVLLLNLL